MAEPASPTRPPWFWPVVALVVVILAALGFAAPSVLECSGSSNGFGSCIGSKLADIGVLPKTAEKTAPQPTATAVAEPAAKATAPEAKANVAPPDFGVRVEPDGSIVIVGSGATSKTVQIFVNGKLYGTAKVDAGGDWVLVPKAPLPPGGYELTLVDPDTGKALDKSYVVAINQDLKSEPLVVASTPGKASEILQGLIKPAEPATAVAQAEPAKEAPAAAPAEPAASKPAASKPAVADTINKDATLPADAASLANTPPTIATATPAPAAKPAEQAVATAAPPQQAAPQEDVVGNVDALQKRIDALKAQAPPTIDAVEIDNGKNFFAGTGADGAVVRVYVDNVYVGDAKVKDGHWLLQTGDVLKNRSQRIRADQLVPGTAEVASRAEIDFIFEAPAAKPPATAVAEAPVKVPPSDFGIDTSKAPDVSAPMTVAEAPPAKTETPAATPAPAAEKPAADTKTASEPAAPAQAASAIQEPATAPAASAAAAAPAASSGTAAASSASGTEAGGTATGVASTGGGSGSAASGGTVAVPKPDFSVDTGIPVVVVPGTPAPAATTTEPAPAAPETPKAETSVATAAPPATEPAAPAQPAIAEPEVKTLIAEPIGPASLGRFSTGKAIIRSGDNLWTIARRVYGSGYKYTQIYGANRDQIRDPDLIYPGQVFSLPDVGNGSETASN